MSQNLRSLGTPFGWLPPYKYYCSLLWRLFGCSLGYCGFDPHPHLWNLWNVKFSKLMMLAQPDWRLHIVASGLIHGRSHWSRANPFWQEKQLLFEGLVNCQKGPIPNVYNTMVQKEPCPPEHGDKEHEQYAIHIMFCSYLTNNTWLWLYFTSNMCWTAATSTKTLCIVFSE